MDANALEQIAHQKVAEICQQKNIQMTPEKVGMKSEPFQSPPSWKASLKIKFDFILDRIKKQEDGMGRNLSHIFQTLPTKLELPEYYKIIKRPMDLDKVQARVKKIVENGGYASMDEFMDELMLVFENATSYNEPGSIIYQGPDILKQIEKTFNPVAPGICLF